MSTLNTTVFINCVSLLKQIISFISYLAKALSLGLRLTASMIDSLALFFLVFLLFLIFDSDNYADYVLIYSFIPLMVYSNAESDKIQLLSENKGKAGIYQWTHLESGKFYIGSAFDLSKRLSQYYSSSYLKEKDYYISRALIHHTYSAFSLSILEYINISNLSKEEARKLILSREQYFLDEIFSLDEPFTYNILKVAGSSLGFLHSVETVAKLSEIGKGKTRENNPMFGKTHSTETIILMSEAKIGENNPMFGKTGIGHPNYGKTLSDGTKAKMSEAHKGENNSMSKKVFIYSSDPLTKETILYKSFDTCTEAAKYFNCSQATISRYLDKNKLYKNQWIFSSLSPKE